MASPVALPLRCSLGRRWRSPWEARLLPTVTTATATTITSATATTTTNATSTATTAATAAAATSQPADAYPPSRRPRAATALATAAAVVAVASAPGGGRGRGRLGLPSQLPLTWGTAGAAGAASASSDAYPRVAGGWGKRAAATLQPPPPRAAVDDNGGDGGVSGGGGSSSGGSSSGGGGHHDDGGSGGGGRQPLRVAGRRPTVASEAERPPSLADALRPGGSIRWFAPPSGGGGSDGDPASGGGSGGATPSPPEPLNATLSRHASAFARLSRLDRPVGTALLFLPGAWGITAAAAAAGTFPPDAHLLALFGVGAALLRGAGCTANDMWDADVDARVARTRRRPLAAREVSLAAAGGWLTAQLGAGLPILLALNGPAIVAGAAAVVPALAYPLAKRYVAAPQVVLGAVFNWPAVVGYLAAGGEDPAVAAALYAAGAAWTVVYDTVYATPDAADDAALGLSSLAVMVAGDRRRRRRLLGGALAVKAGALAAAGVAASFGPAYWVGAAAAIAHVGRMVTATERGSGSAAAFEESVVAGCLTWAAIAAGAWGAAAGGGA